eukprot:2841583-Rhodomonas_salina.1
MEKKKRKRSKREARSLQQPAHCPRTARSDCACKGLLPAAAHDGEKRKGGRGRKERARREKEGAGREGE